MTEALSAELIIVNLSSQIKLNWLAGQEDPGQPIHTVDVNTHATLIGHLNLIHKNIIQVIGKTEHRYLQGLDEKIRDSIFEQVFSKSTAAIIIADSIKDIDVYVEQANEKRVPLLGCDADSNTVVDVARYYLHDIFSDRETIHGVYMEVLGAGILITGESSIGKSELALELITRGHRLIADDAPEFTKIGPEILDGKSPRLLKDFMEVRGLGVLNVREMYGDNALKEKKHLRLIINMQTLSAEELEKIDRLLGSRHIRTILGVDIPEILLPVAPGRNLAVLVEAAVRNHLLRCNGQDASEELIELQKRAIEEDRL